MILGKALLGLMTANSNNDLRNGRNGRNGKK